MATPASRWVIGAGAGGVWPVTTTRWAGKAAILAVAAAWPPRRRWLVQAGPAWPGESAARLCGTISAGVQAGLNDAANKPEPVGMGDGPVAGDDAGGYRRPGAARRGRPRRRARPVRGRGAGQQRSEAHTSELKSLMSISYA